METAKSTHTIFREREHTHNISRGEEREERERAHTHNIQRGKRGKRESIFTQYLEREERERARTHTHHIL